MPKNVAMSQEKRDLGAAMGVGIVGLTFIRFVTRIFSAGFNMALSPHEQLGLQNFQNPFHYNI